jgi:hypothetical protein
MPIATMYSDEVIPRLSTCAWPLALGHWLGLLLACEMVLILGVEYLEIGPRPIYLLENIFQTIYILINKTEHSA